jgi:hypothetical protein
MHSIMLPRNPLPATFPLLLDTFRSSHRIHRLIELNLVAGANFALGWICKWHPKLNYSTMSLSLAPGGASLRVHMENMLQPARRLIARLLEADAAFFREYHYLDPLGVDDSETRCCNVLCIWNARVSYFVTVVPKSLFSKRYCVSHAFTAFFPVKRLVNSNMRNDLSLFILVI